MLTQDVQVADNLLSARKTLQKYSLCDVTANGNHFTKYGMSNICLVLSIGKKSVSHQIQFFW